MLKALKFDRTKEDFTAFSTKFLDLVSKGYNAFDSATLDFVASTALREKLPLAWLNKLDDVHYEDLTRIAFSNDWEVCQFLQDTE